MTTLVTLETNVGYIVSEDVYVAFSEYYGDGTIYGRVDLLTAYGEPVKGAGKTKIDLINENTILSRDNMGSVTGDLIVVQNDVFPEVVAPVVQEEAPVVTEEASAAPVTDTPPSDLYTVNLSMFGFTITREFAVKIDHEKRQIYLN